MPPRPGSLLDRLYHAGLMVLGRDGREERGSEAAPAPFISVFGGMAGMPHPFKPYESLGYYDDNPYLFAGVSITAQEASRVKLKLFKRKKNGEHDEVLDHQALTTLNRPMPIDQGKAILTGMQLRHLIYTHMKLNGEGFFLMDGRMPKKYGGGPSMLHPLLPAFMLVQLDESYQIKNYIYRAAGGQINLAPLDVVHFKDPDPKNWYRGHSPVQPARFALDSNREADLLNYHRFLNGAMPGGLLSPETKLSPEEQKRLQDVWNQKYGGSQNSGKTAVLPAKMTYEKTQESNVDMQYAELKGMTRDEVLAALRIPIEMLGKTDNQTRANADASNYVFQRFTILPLVESFVDTLNNDFLPAFPNSQDLFFGFDPFVPEDLENKRATTQTLFGTGALTPNEARQGFGMDVLEIPQADIPFLPFNVVPLTAQNPNPPKDEDLAADLEGDDVDEEDELTEDEERGRKVRADAEEEDLPDDVPEFFDAKKETTLLAGVKLAFLLQGFRQGIDLANQTGAKAIPIESVFTASVRQAIEARNLEKAAQAVQTTEEQLRALLTQARADGVGVRELARRINDLYGESMGYRSLRIARTELTGVMGEGQYRTFREQGYAEKTWSTTMDGHERDSHAEANGQTVPIDQPFKLAGGEAMYPGDPSLPPAELCNCRCIPQPAGVPEDRRATINEQFLRAHGSIEGTLTSAIKDEFARQHARVIAALRKG